MDLQLRYTALNINIGGPPVTGTPADSRTERKSILFAGLLNFLNKPRFRGWPIDYMSVYLNLPSEMKFAEAIGAPLFNGNGWANTSLIQSETFRLCKC